MATVGDIVADAFFQSGIIGTGQTGTGQDARLGFRLYNQLVAQWNRKRYMVYTTFNIGIPCTGAISYSVGIGGDFNTPRPDKIEDGCFLRQLNTGSAQPVDYVLQLVNSREDYNRIRLKTMGTFPWLIYYDPTYPLGNVYAWPVPQANNYSLYIQLKVPLLPAATLGDTINLPDEYQAALDYNLQVRLRAAYRLAPDPVIIGLAKDAMNVVRGANTQIATLRMPRALIGNQIAYSVFSDN